MFERSGAAARRRGTSALCLAVLLLPFAGQANAAPPATAAKLSFENRHVKLTLLSNGQVAGLWDKHGRRELAAPAPHPLAVVTVGSRSYASTLIERRGRELRVGFGRSGAHADYRITARRDALIIELRRVHPATAQKIAFALLQLRALPREGVWANARYDDRMVVSLLALDPRVDARLQGAAVTAWAYSELGLSGRRAALVAVAPQDFLAVVGELQRAYRVPVSRLGGKTAKLSTDAKSSYLFIDLTEANADEVIRYAKLGGFRHVLIYASSWAASIGSYPINRKNYPRGEASLTATVAKLHRAGLKVGLHMLAGVIARTDPLVRPLASRHLLAAASSRLAAPLAARSTQVTLVPTDRVFAASSVNVDLQIDEELMTCQQRVGATTLARCTRGKDGTRVATHAAGASVKRLQLGCGAYVADLDSPLLGLLARRFSGLIERTRMDMLYVDCGGGRVAPGRDFYWAGALQTEILRHVRRPLLLQGSGLTHWLWQLYARYACDDFSTVARASYLDHHKLRLAAVYRTSFLPPELGWWGFLDAAPAHRATRPEDVEHYAVRMLAHDLPGSLETSVAMLRANSRSLEFLRLHGAVERARLRGLVSPALREALRRGRWRVLRDGTRLAFRPVRFVHHTVATPAQLLVVNPFADQPLAVRLEAMPQWAPPGDPANRVLWRSAQGVGLGMPRGHGALAARLAFPRLPGEIVAATARGSKAVDLSQHRALAVRLSVAGPLSTRRPAVLNVQLEQTGRAYRDHHIDLSFRGERVVVLREPTSSRTLAEFPPDSRHYFYKMAMHYFDYRRVVAINLRWMRSAPAIRVEVLGIEALAERPAQLRDPTLSAGNRRLTLPLTLKTGSYAELIDGDEARLFDPHGGSLGSVTPRGQRPRLASGQNVVRIEAAAPGAVRLTVVLQGAPRWR